MILEDSPLMANQGKQVEGQMEPGWGSMFRETSTPHWPCLDPQSYGSPGIQPHDSLKESSSLGEPDNKIAGARGLKRRLETAPTSSPEDTVQ